MKGIGISLCVGLLSSIAVAQSDPASRLQHARTLRCEYTAVATTTWKAGRRTMASEKTGKPDEVTYDAIDVAKGTARIIGNVGAGDILVRAGGGALWFIETTPVGNIYVATVFPTYAAGTNDFVIVESRHTDIFGAILAEQSSGTCTVLD